jgi:hypothetical protein
LKMFKAKIRVIKLILKAIAISTVNYEQGEYIVILKVSEKDEKRQEQTNVQV